MIRILYSADYELFLGSNQLSEREILLEPTHALLQCGQRIGVPITLFCDCACLWRYRTLGREDFPLAAEQQLQQALLAGHDVQAHLHPHWFWTDFIGEAFCFPPESYRLGTLPMEPEQRSAWTVATLRQMRRYLETLLQPINPDYRCLSFRAGGYGVQPETTMILAALLEAGFRIDSSLVPGWQFQNPLQQVDFRALPRRANYWLHPAHGLAPAPTSQGLYEIPIAAATMTRWEQLRHNLPLALQGALAVLINQQPKTQRGTPCNEPTPHAPVHRIKQAWWRFNALLANRFLRLELANQSPERLLLCTERYLKHLEGHDPSHDPAHPQATFALNCHPKGLNSRSLETLEQLHSTLLRRWGKLYQATTFRQCAQELPKQTRHPVLDHKYS